ncbi:hypothetical protein BDF22DRAFT_744938 [Syncephalis plumigaleata]|nr:hypothetical protein BDF22DRAFT_744938 [Syncephalis plumigaleata]
MRFHIDLWCFNLNDIPSNEQLLESWLQLLPSNESDRIRRYRHRVDQWRSLIGRLLVRCWLIQQHQCVWSDIRMTTGIYGKPSTRGYYITGTCNTNQLLDSMQYQFSSDEWQTISAQLAMQSDHTLSGLMARWALKEATVKSLGWGIAHPDLRLNELSFQFTNPQDIVSSEDEQKVILCSDIDVKINNSMLASKHWQFQLNRLDTNHLMALAITLPFSATDPASDNIPRHPIRITWQQLLEWITLYT